jgi:predicted ATPase/class 3 adenylate cyclase/Tfp pilus assembly protein PilF
MANLPTGTVTFLFTDIEGSTKLAQGHPEQWESLRERHHAILQAAMDAHNGYVFQIIGDAFCVAFHTASDGLHAAIDAQRQLKNENWGEMPIKVRMGIHTGEAEKRENDYRGYLTLVRVQRIMSAGHGGQILLSNATAELIRGQLPEDITLRDMKENHLKGWTTSEHLWQVVTTDLWQDFPSLSTLNSIPNNLPVQVTSFVGREQEIAELKQSLTKTRLVTLTGSGGTGKTRLSLQVATEILDRFKDGVWLIELAPITDPTLVPNTVANILGVRGESGRPLMTTLMDWFSDRELLILLDNCEHLLDACAKFTDAVLRGSHKIRILASSREALGIAGETAYRVPSLPTPSPKEKIEIERLEKYESVQLFIERAAQTLPTFKVTNATSPALTQICHRLDGIPLAIELAAARVKVLSVEQIAERLDDRFRLLTGGSRTALPRQQTLRALIDWSYHLLSEQERLLFRRLAVFVGGWTLEAAEAVCGFSQGGIESSDVLDLLSHLVDKSLVIFENAGKESRYRRLETIRQYAREKLFETEEAAQIRDRHLDYFRTLAEKAEIEILNANQVAWLKRLNDEFDNIRAAMEWSQEKRAEDGLRLGSAIWRFCLRYGYTNEIVEKLNQLLQHPQGTRRTLVRAKTLYALSILAGVGQSDRIRQHARADESLAIYKELGNQKGEADGLYALGVAAAFSSDPKAALSLLLQSLALYRAINDKTDVCDVLIMICRVSREPIQRQVYLEEALALSRERGDAITMAGALDNLGLLAMDLGNFPQARAWLEESLELQLPLGAPGYISTLQCLSKLAIYGGDLVQARAYGNEVAAMSKKAGMLMAWEYLWSLANLGYIALREGNIAQAKEIFGHSIQQFQKANSLIGVVYVIEGLASLHVNQEQLGRATQLFAWANAFREKVSDHRPSVEQASVEKDLAVIHSKVDDAEFKRLSADGRTMTVEKAIVLALEENTE